MTLPLLALLLTAAPPLEQAARTVQLPPGRQEIVYRLPIVGNPVRVAVSWSADQEVSVVLIEEGQFRLRRQGLAHTPVAYGEFEREGAVSGWLSGTGTYLVVADNRMNPQRPAQVGLRLNWEKAGRAIHPDPARARTLVYATSSLFLLLCLIAGARLRRGLESRP